MTKAILFDFNGVIINDEPLHCEALIHTLAEYGIDLDRDTYYREYLGFDDRECFRYSFTRADRPSDPASIADATERKNAAWERLVKANMKMVPGAADFVRAAAAEGLRLAIVSGALRREIELVLSRGGLAALFDLVVAAEDVPACKPDPAGYNQARGALRVAAEDCMVVEDSLPGLQAARAAGLRCAMVSTSHPVESLAGADSVWPDFVGRRPADLPWVNSRG
jgi:HAD superfamily hydrolase (TIGR01509 family)